LESEWTRNNHTFGLVGATYGLCAWLLELPGWVLTNKYIPGSVNTEMWFLPTATSDLYFPGSITVDTRLHFPFGLLVSDP